VASQLDALAFSQLRTLVDGGSSDLHIALPDILDPDEDVEIGYYGILRSGTKPAHAQLAIEDYVAELQAGEFSHTASKADIQRRLSNVRFTPESNPRSAPRQCCRGHPPPNCGRARPVHRQIQTQRASHARQEMARSQGGNGTFWDSECAGSDAPALGFKHGFKGAGIAPITRANAPFWNLRAFDTALARHDGYMLSSFICAMNLPVPQSKDKRSSAARQDKRVLVRQGATIFKKESIAEKTK